jgi:NMD protein affecting ribosome stability and mRNA decay
MKPPKKPNGWYEEEMNKYCVDCGEEMELNEDGLCPSCESEEQAHFHGND